MFKQNNKKWKYYKENKVNYIYWSILNYVLWRFFQKDKTFTYFEKQNTIECLAYSNVLASNPMFVYTTVYIE